MKCLYCGENMEKGLIASSEPINFLKEVRFVNRPDKRRANSTWQRLLLEDVLQ